MKLIYFLLSVFLFSCGSQSQPPHLKHVKAGNLQFFETYSFAEIAPSWETACKWIHEHDTLAAKKNLSMTENPGGLNALVRPNSNFTMWYANEEDMSRVDAMLAIPEVKKIFPADLRFMWSYGVEETQNGHKMYALYVVKVPTGNKAIVDGKSIISAEATISEYMQRPVVSITMDSKGAHDWEIMTRKNIGRTIAITIDDHVLSCPVVNDAIAGGKTEISGNFTKAEAEELAARIYAGRK